MELTNLGLIGAACDVPGPDVGTGTREMNWMKDCYSYLRGHKDLNASAVCTGKSISQGGIDGRVESTGLGAYYAIRHLLSNDQLLSKHKLTKGLAGKTFAVQVKKTNSIYFLFSYKVTKSIISGSLRPKLLKT